MTKLTIAQKRQAEEELAKEVPLNVAGDPILAHCELYVEAIYRNSSSELPECAGNALILALPEFNREAIIDGMKIGFAIQYSNSIRRRRREQRMAAIARITWVWVLLPVHLQLLDWVYTALRSRYVGFRSTDDIKREMQRRYGEIQSGRFRPFAAPHEPHSECLPIFALSGVGKTTAIKMVLSTLPMVINHKSYAGTKLGIAQAVWVFVTCPHNGSVTTLLRGIIEWFDFYLETRYVAEMGSRPTSADWIAKVIFVLSRHYTGLLIIDEIQNALRAANRREMIDFLTTLFNARCCAFICLGTPEAEEQMPHFRTRRRVSSGGMLSMTPFVRGKEWDRFANALIEQDFQLVPFDNPEKIRETLYVLSAGMPAIAKLVWRLSQYEAIFLEDDESDPNFERGKITPALMEMAASRGLGLVEGLLQAIRTRNYKEVAELTDLAEKKVVAYIADATFDREADRELDASELRVKRALVIAGTLIDLGVPLIEAEKYARDAIASGDNVPISTLFAAQSHCMRHRRDNPIRREKCRQTPLLARRPISVGRVGLISRDLTGHVRDVRQDKKERSFCFEEDDENAPIDGGCANDLLLRMFGRCGRCVFS